MSLAEAGQDAFLSRLSAPSAPLEDSFVTAPGIKGLVMTVFTLSSFPYVFKLIKDVSVSEGNDRAQ